MTDSGICIYEHKQFRIIAIHNAPIDEVTYIVADRAHEECIVIDASNSDMLLQVLSDLSLIPSMVLLTHEHIDHINAVNALVERYQVRILCQEMCAANIKDSRKNLAAFLEALLEFHGYKDSSRYASFKSYRILSPAETYKDELSFDWHGISITLKAMPGHSAGGTSIQIGDALFTGDNLLANVKTCTVLPGGSKKAFLEVTAPLLKAYPSDLKVYPGHGKSFLLCDGNWQ